MMNYAYLTAVIIIGAFLNRARGSNFAGFILSDTETRILSMSGFGLMTALYFHPFGFEVAGLHFDEAAAFGLMFIMSTLLLWLWCAEGWDALWGEATGLTPGSDRFVGTIKLTIRMALILPFYLFLLTVVRGPAQHAAYAASFLLMGVTYYLSAKWLPGPNIIRNAEWANGAIIAATIWLIGHSF